VTPRAPLCFLDSMPDDAVGLKAYKSAINRHGGYELEQIHPDLLQLANYTVLCRAL
jgi:hypothetical protein